MLHTVRTAAVATASIAILLGTASFSAQAKESAFSTAFGQSEQPAVEETATPTEETSTVTGSFDADTEETSTVTGSFDADAEDAGIDLTFTLINSSLVDIHYVFVSPETSESWGDDWLGQDILPAGYEIDLPVYGEADECVYDIQVISSYGETLEFWGVDLCEVTEVEVQ